MRLLDDSELPQLRLDLAAAKKVEEWVGTGIFYTNENGKKEEILKKNEPAYSEAQALIAELDGVDGKIARLEGLAEVLNSADKIIADALNEVQASYGREVAGINPIFVQPLSLPRDAAL